MRSGGAIGNASVYYTQRPGFNIWKRKFWEGVDWYLRGSTQSSTCEKAACKWWQSPTVLCKSEFQAVLNNLYLKLEVEAAQDRQCLTSCSINCLSIVFLGQVGQLKPLKLIISVSHFQECCYFSSWSKSDQNWVSDGHWPGVKWVCKGCNAKTILSDLTSIWHRNSLHSNIETFYIW